MKEKHYVVIIPHQWGASHSLYEAFQNAHAIPPSLFDSCLRSIQYDYDRPEEMAHELKVCNDEPECWQDDGDLEAVVVVTWTSLWEFTGCSEMDGSPSYNWVGEGDKPKYAGDSVKILIDKATGGISLRK